MTRLPRTRRRTALLHWLAAAGLALAVPAAGQEDWPGFRGPNRDGQVTGWTEAMNDPQRWPESLERRWRTPVGLGHASPVVHDGSVIVFSREGDDEVLRALRAATGEEIWRSSYAAPYTMNRSALGHGPGPKGTPELAAGRIFTLGISGILSAWDAGDGSLLWRRPPDPRFAAMASPLYGAGSSPGASPAGDVVFVHLGGPDNGTFAALDAATGETVWELAGDGPAYVSPKVAEVAGVPVIPTMTEERIVLLAPQDGRVLWEAPFTTPYDQNIVNPLVLPGGETVIFAGLGSPTFTVRFHRTTNGGLAGDTVWRAADSPFYMSNPVLAGDRLIGFSERNSGQFVALDLETGESIWRSPPRAGENAAVLIAGATVLALTDQAELLVLDAAATSFEPVRRYEVAPSPTWAHPVPVGDGLLVKDETHLARWGFR
jgi:outer membrane protein assembly factor BamB